MDKYICVHGHFYQPPRENPWLEEVEAENSAAPFHDWNERITSECYAPNSASRILDSQKKIIDIVNNYSRMSFDFGPTLLSWLARHRPDVYEAVLQADQDSRGRFSGHGSALGQAYNHMIMPLANSRDKRTQIIWGIRDFEHRFQRRPEGMWLPETAVDQESLEIMAGEGIKFTILSPRQALAMRRIGEQEWVDLNGKEIDFRMPYVCPLGGSRTMNVFFYDGPASHDVAFGDLLKDGRKFASRLLADFAGKKEGPQLVHIATDGESYGHHNRFGDMALAYSLNEIEGGNEARLTVYGEFLEKFPPTHEVKIAWNSSWSCVHGVERWRGDCGCQTGRHPGWKQGWRAPLREAMDWLRDELVSHFEGAAAGLLNDPWSAREDYIGLVLDRSEPARQAFLSRHAARDLSKEEHILVLRLLEMQRCAMLMYTSCGWFFDDISGLESVQILKYAARAMQLARETGGLDREGGFVRRLKKAPGNVPEYGDGASIYEHFVKPAVVDLLSFGAHFAVSSPFRDYSEEVSIGCFTARSLAFEQWRDGPKSLTVGRVRLVSGLTLEDKTLRYAVLHSGDDQVMAGVRQDEDGRNYGSMSAEMRKQFQKNKAAAVIGLIDKYLGTHDYSLDHLFRDGRAKVMNQVLQSSLDELEFCFRRIYENRSSVWQAMREMKIPLPESFILAVKAMLTADLRRALNRDKPDLEETERLADEFKKWSLAPGGAELASDAGRRIENLMAGFSLDPHNPDILETIGRLLKLFRDPDSALDLWKSQNILFSVYRDIYAGMEKKADGGDETARRWVEKFGEVAGILGIKV